MTIHRIAVFAVFWAILTLLAVAHASTRTYSSDESDEDVSLYVSKMARSSIFGRKALPDSYINCQETESALPQEAPPQRVTGISITAKPLSTRNTPSEERVLKRVVPGKDGRTRIQNTSSWPNCVHGVVYIRFPKMQRDTYCWGSGTLVAPHVVLTAAHNLYDRARGKRAEEVRFFPAINGKKTVFPEPEVLSFFYPESYKYDGVEDYGVLLLDTSLVRYTGHFGLGVMSPTSIENMPVSIVGYPGDKVENKDKEYEMWGMQGPVKKVDATYLHYELDTYCGQSGSAVWVQRGDQYTVIGVHVLGDEALGVNKAILLTEARFKEIRGWVHNAFEVNFVKITCDSLNSLNLDRGSTYSDLCKCTDPCKFPNIKSLSINHCNFVEHKHIYSALTKLKKLERFSCSSDSLMDRSLSGIQEALEGNISLTYLSLAKLGISSVRSIGIGLRRNTTLTFLNLSRSPIGDRGVEILVTHLSENTALKSLWLSRVGATSSCLKHIKNLILMHPTLDWLDFSNNAIEDSGATIFGEILEANPNLDALCLSETKITDKGINALACALEKNTTLRVLWLQDNDFGDRGAQYLINALQLNTTLDRLDMWRNRVKSELIIEIETSVNDTNAYRPHIETYLK